MTAQTHLITTAQALAAVKAHGTKTAAAKALGVGTTTVARALARGNKPAAKTARTALGRSVSDFAKSYDKDTIIPQKINAALVEMDGWLYESEFVKLASISFADASAYRDKYADHLVYIKRDNKRVWCSTKTMAAKLREMLS